MSKRFKGEYASHFDGLAGVVENASQMLARKDFDALQQTRKWFYAWGDVICNTVLPSIDYSLQQNISDEKRQDLEKLRGLMVSGMLGLARCFHVQINNALQISSPENYQPNLKVELEYLRNVFYLEYLSDAVSETIHENPIDWPAEIAQDTINTYLHLDKIEEAIGLSNKTISGLESELQDHDAQISELPPRELFSKLQSLAVHYRRRGELNQSQRDQVFAMEAIYEADKIIPVTTRRKALAQYAVKASVTQWRALEPGDRALNFIRGATTAVRMETRELRKRFIPRRSKH